MRRSFPRSDRIGDQLHRALAVVIQQELTDPRLKFATVQAVRLSVDRSAAFVRITCLSELDQAAAVEVLNQQAGYIRGLVARHCSTLRHMPRFQFESDLGWVHEERVHRLLERAKPKDQSHDDAAGVEDAE